MVGHLTETQMEQSLLGLSMYLCQPGTALWPEALLTGQGFRDMGSDSSSGHHNVQVRSPHVHEGNRNDTRQSVWP